MRRRESNLLTRTTGGAVTLQPFRERLAAANLVIADLSDCRSDLGRNLSLDRSEPAFPILRWFCRHGRPDRQIVDRSFRASDLESDRAFDSFRKAYSVRNYRKTQNAEANLRKQGRCCVKLHSLMKLRLCFGDREVPFLLWRTWKPLLFRRSRMPFSAFQYLGI